MKRWTLPSALLAVGGVLLVIAVILGGVYNGLVQDREKVTKSLSDVQVQYQRRADLVPNLVNTVKGSSDFEQDTLTNVTEARANATKVTLDVNNPDSVQQYMNAQNQLSGSLSRLIATVEAYPDIKSTAAYQDLMNQLEGTENRISVARSDYGAVAQGYNARIQTFPTNIVAGIFGFKAFPYFQADAGASTAPSVDFGN